MRLVLGLVAAGAIFYSGYWFVGSRTLTTSTEAAFAEMNAAGLGGYGALGLSGFPGRFDLTLTEPELTSADGALRWSAPEMRLYALSYRPHHVIAVLPPAMTLRYGREEIAVTSGELRASAVVGIDTALPLKRAQSVGRTIELRSERGWSAAAGELRLAVREGAEATEQELGAELMGLSLSGLPAELFGPDGALPGEGERARLDAVLSLDRPLDRFAPADGLRITAAELRALELDWGPLSLRGTGQVAFTPSGEPEGRIELGIRNWRAALPLAAALGLIRPEIAPTVEKMLEQLALAGGDAEELDLPLVFAGGRMSLGPVPLGPAPRF